MAMELMYRTCYALKHIFEWVQRYNITKQVSFLWSLKGQDANDAKRWEPSKGEPKNCVGILHYRQTRGNANKCVRKLSM